MFGMKLLVFVIFLKHIFSMSLPAFESFGNGKDFSDPRQKRFSIWKAKMLCNIRPGLNFCRIPLFGKEGRRSIFEKNGKDFSSPTQNDVYQRIQPSGNINWNLLIKERRNEILGDATQFQGYFETYPHAFEFTPGRYGQYGMKKKMVNAAENESKDTLDLGALNSLKGRHPKERSSSSGSIDENQPKGATNINHNLITDDTTTYSGTNLMMKNQNKGISLNELDDILSEPANMIDSYPFEEYTKDK